jgi:hypothetical protein
MSSLYLHRSSHRGSPMQARAFRLLLMSAPLAAPLLVGCGGYDEDPHEFAEVLRVSGSNGTLDSADCSRIQGWAWDPSHPNTSIQVDIYDGEKLIKTVDADRFRKDLKRIKMGDGNHGFVFDSRERLKDGKSHEVHARISGTKTELRSSPKMVSCSQ